MQQTLKQIVGDRSLSPYDASVWRDFLAILPALLKLKEHGYGELIAKVQNGKVVHGRASFDWTVSRED